MQPQNIYVKRKRFLSVFFGVFMLILTVGIAALCFYVIPKYAELEEIADKILIYFAGCFFTVAGLIYAVLGFINARHEFVIYTDEKGIYHYSGLVHMGFIPWEGVADIICISKLWSLFENSARIRIVLKEAYWYKMSKFKRFCLALAGTKITVKTLFTNVNAQELYPVLKETLKYYHEREEQ